MFKAIGKWWRRNQRETDMNILWPQCLKHAGDRHKADEWRGPPYAVLDLARACFARHCFRDTAWTKDFTSKEIEDFIGGLHPGARKPL